MTYNLGMPNMPTNSAQMHTALASIISNKRRVSALKSLGITTVEDALTYYPFRVTNPLKVARLRDIRIGEEVVFYAQVQSINVVPMNARRGSRLEINVVQNQRDAAQLIYFANNRQYLQWLSAKLHVGAMIVVGGMSSAFNGRLQFTHPRIVTVVAEEVSSNVAQSDDTVRSVEEGLARLSAPQPIYHANSRISSERIHETILDILSLMQPAESLSNPSPNSNPNPSPNSNPNSNPSPSPNPNPNSLPIPDILPESVRSKRNLMTRAQAIYAVHHPQSTEGFHKALATLRYEEAFISQIAVLQSRENVKNNRAITCDNSELRQQFVTSLPFALTHGQQEVIDEIVGNMRESRPMRRLLQGEVGSGKTVVALAAMLEAVGSGYQTVLVAPTQVLAAQHAENLRQMVRRANIDVPVVVVTGGMKLAERRRALASVASGEPALIVATHAAFSSSFKPTRLALVVIDEQHRFGVEQRNVLMRNMSVKARDVSVTSRNASVSVTSHDAECTEFTPHLLVMTATPIPRSAAMTWFGDLDVSYLTELPGGRKPIRTFVVQESDARTMASMFAHIRTRIDAGERAYVVCAHIEDDAGGDGESEEAEGFDDIARSLNYSQLSQSSNYLQSSNYSQLPQSPQLNETPNAPIRKLHTVTGIIKRLSALPQFKGIKFAQLTGRDDDNTKRETMERFMRGDVQVLVSTTVIEVGVDVPQASCIVIFDADRFGLAQLHQLRGRVGRGGTQSWAFLVAQTEAASVAQERLQVVERSLDGAVIAQKDLELRNVGDVLGSSQSGGHSSLKLLRVVQDAQVIVQARDDAEETLRNCGVSLDSLPYLAGAVLDFTRGGSAQIVSN